MDYTNFSAGGPKTALPESSRKWWDLQPKEMADAISGTLNQIQQHQTRRVNQMMISARLYGNMSTLGGGMAMTQLMNQNPVLRDRITYNVVQSVIDTITAKIAKNKPKPLFLTSGGDYKKQRVAKKRNMFMDGVFYENNAHALGVDVFRDACINGDGVVHVYVKDGRVKYARVPAAEIYVDELEGYYGNVRQMHWVRPVDRGQLADAFPGKRSKIMAATATPFPALPNVADLVTVRESWHLPSGKDAGDGKHTITIDGETLLAPEKWEHDFFPFARFTWCKRVWGYWGQGLVEQIQNIQVEINKLLFVVQKSLHLGGSHKLLLERGSKIVTEHLNNEVGAVIHYTGTPPQYIVPPLVQPEIYQHIVTLVQRAYEQSGVSMLSAVSQKPAGINSGKALREFNDIESDRFQVVGQANEQLYIQLTKLTMTVARDAELDGYKVQVPGRNSMRVVDWADIDGDDEDFITQCFPVSSLPDDPAGRLQTIQEYAQAGYVTPRQARKLLDFPDLEQTESLQNAQEEYIGEILEKIVDDGEYTPPEPFDDLQLFREMALQWYAKGKIQQLEEERLEMLRRLMSQIDTLQTMAQPPAPPPTAAAPGAAPEAAPTSDLLPNAPGLRAAA